MFCFTNNINNKLQCLKKVVQADRAELELENIRVKDGVTSTQRRFVKGEPKDNVSVLAIGNKRTDRSSRVSSDKNKSE